MESPWEPETDRAGEGTVSLHARPLRGSESLSGGGWCSSGAGTELTVLRMEGQCSRCKIVVVGDTQCGKTALLHVFAKDSYPEVNASCYLSSIPILPLKEKQEISY